MTPLAVTIDRPLGFVEFDGVWLDDRRRCTWALCDLSFVATPGAVVAIDAPHDAGAADGIFDLLTGRRLPVRGTVGIDGVDLRDFDRVSHLRSLAIVSDADTGERRLVVGGRTIFVAEPSTATIRTADVVLRFDAGFAAARERVGVGAG
ncbi:MAG TPA: hypothetical protein VM345_19810 [Acidimicrobiales bacterium]|nr:hypothetical protein [Acidimicrobiales bacterium]